MISVGAKTWCCYTHFASQERLPIGHRCQAALCPLDFFRGAWFDHPDSFVRRWVYLKGARHASSKSRSSVVVDRVGSIGHCNFRRRRLSGGPAETAAEVHRRQRDLVAARPLAVLLYYYREVVSDEQREKIYAIQAEYRKKLAPLKDQIVALIKEQNAKIEAVLSSEQLKKVEQIKAEALAKRKKAAEAKEIAEKRPAK